MPYADLETRRAYHREYYKRNKKHLDGYRQNYRKNNIELEKEWQQTYRESSVEERKIAARKRRYGISNNTYNLLLEAQANCCDICSIEFSDKVRPNIDHCHQTNKVRGILCIRCNTLLGNMGDSLEGLEKTYRKFKAYLE